MAHDYPAIRMASWWAGFQGRRRNWRGIFALGFLFVSALASYGLVFVLIDKWYKGGSLGIL